MQIKRQKIKSGFPKTADDKFLSPISLSASAENFTKARRLIVT